VTAERDVCDESTARYRVGRAHDRNTRGLGRELPHRSNYGGKSLGHVVWSSAEIDRRIGHTEIGTQLRDFFWVG
jgi:hypothetical protein